MKDCNLTIGLLGCVVLGVTLLGGAASAQEPPPEFSEAGGLPACEEAVAICTEDLTTCEDDLAACEESQVVFPGDGAGNGAPLAYEVCADGLTVADRNTGLLWERKMLGGGGSATCLTELHGVASACTWTQATGDWINAVNAEGGMGFAGFSDWRVPNVKELQSIVDYGTFDPAIDPSFGPTTSGGYWSSTPVAFDRPDAWGVFSLNGRVFNGGQTSAFNVRAVRSGSCSTP